MYDGTAPGGYREPNRHLKPNKRPILIAAAVIAVLSWVLPVLSLVLLPLQFLNTYIHELCHAFAALGTGGRVEHVLVFGDGSGRTPVMGGSAVVIGSAGYVGAAAIGAILLWLSARPKGAHWAIYGLASFIGLGMLLWVRGDAPGLMWGVFWVICLYVAGWALRGDAILFLAQFIGIQQCLTAFQSVFGLLQISAFHRVHSDAMILAELTGAPPLLWALGWTLLSLSLMVVALREAWGQD